MPHRFKYIRKLPTAPSSAHAIPDQSGEEQAKANKNSIGGGGRQRQPIGDRVKKASRPSVTGVVTFCTCASVVCGRQKKSKDWGNNKQAAHEVPGLEFKQDPKIVAGDPQV